MHGRQGARPDAEQFLDRQAVDDLAGMVRVHAAHAVGLVQVGGDFGQQLVRRNPHRCREARLELNAAADFAPHRFRAPQQLLTRGDIEKRLVQRQAFDQRRKFMKNRKDLFRHLFVARHSRRHADGLRAAAQCLAHGHGGADAEAAHRIAGRRHHPPAARAADDQGLALELRAILFFHGRIEGVHVDVQYRPHVISR